MTGLLLGNERTFYILTHCRLDANRLSTLQKKPRAALKAFFIFFSQGIHSRLAMAFAFS